MKIFENKIEIYVNFKKDLEECIKKYVIENNLKLIKQNDNKYIIIKPRLIGYLWRNIIFINIDKNKGCYVIRDIGDVNPTLILIIINGFIFISIYSHQDLLFCGVAIMTLFLLILLSWSVSRFSITDAFRLCNFKYKSLSTKGNISHFILIFTLVIMICILLGIYLDINKISRCNELVKTFLLSSYIIPIYLIIILLLANLYINISKNYEMSSYHDLRLICFFLGILTHMNLVIYYWMMINFSSLLPPLSLPTFIANFYKTLAMAIVIVVIPPVTSILLSIFILPKVIQLLSTFNKGVIRPLIIPNKKEVKILSICLLCMWVISTTILFSFVFHSLKIILYAFGFQFDRIPDIFWLFGLNSNKYWILFSNYIKYSNKLLLYIYSCFVLLPIILLTLISILPILLLRKDKDVCKENPPDWILNIVDEACNKAKIKNVSVYLTDEELPDARSESNGFIRIRHKIILTRGLLNICHTKEEIAAAIYHEIYHLKHNTRVKNLLSVLSTITFFGGKGVLPAIAGFSVHEFLADEFAARNTNPDAVINLLNGILENVKQNQKEKDSSSSSSLMYKIYKVWNAGILDYFHPSLIERIKYIEKIKKSQMYVV